MVPFAIVIKREIQAEREQNSLIMIDMQLLQEYYISRHQGILLPHRA